MKKPRFWLYWVGFIALIILCFLSYYFGLVLDASSLYLLSGVFLIEACHVHYDLMNSKMAYWRSVRDQEVQQDV